MQEHIIKKEDGSEIKWSTTKNNGSFCLLYKDNNQKYKFTPTENLICELFMIGGGGAGGYFFGGGGGAGASYINNNYIFKKNKTYTFEIGSGGMCDIVDINELFKSGLNLSIYNNTDTDLSKINFMYDDYSSLGIQNSGIIQTFNVNNITIPSSILNNNTTYIWDGYIKTNSTGYFNITINSKMNTIIWLDKFIYTNANALIEGNNINDVKIVQLKSNRFYNIKIIVYNYNIVASNNNFNISFKDCEFYNFDKTKENYKYQATTDTILTYKNDDNSFETIRCKGGGNGGCGFYNKNKNLNGGCGGGSGINKIKGSSIIEAIYNGNDGASGDYCGGGGGIISPGNNNKGGNGKIIEWFNSTLIFGAGGNAANLNETRNLGYGCGGNGGECCYYSKLLINNNGNNGCILIYVKSNNNTTPLKESFAEKTVIMLPDTSIAKKLVEESFKIADNNNYAIDNTRRAFFTTSLSYYDSTYMMLDFDPATNIILNPSTAVTDDYGYSGYDNLLNQTFIYDMLIISKLYAIIYRLYWYHFNITLKNDNLKWKNFVDNAILTFSSGVATATNIDNNTVNLNNLFIFETLKINTAQQTVSVLNTSLEYNAVLYGGNSASTVNMHSDVYTKYVTNRDGTNTDSSTTDYTTYVPLYHLADTGGILTCLDELNTELLANKYYKMTISAVGAAASIDRTTIHTNCSNVIYTGIGSAATCTFAAGQTDLKILSATSKLDSATLSSAYTTINATSFSANNKYVYQRAYLYLEAFNIILNTDSTYILSLLKYHMHYYNLVVYNASIQYKLNKLQDKRIKASVLAEVTSAQKCLLTSPSTDYEGKTVTTTELIPTGGGTCAAANTYGTAKKLSGVAAASSAIDTTDLNTYLDKLTTKNIKLITNNLNNSSDFIVFGI